MIIHQFSKRFKKDTDLEFKNEQFEERLSKFMVGFIECYPHLIQKKDFDSKEEDWIFKFFVELEEKTPIMVRDLFLFHFGSLIEKHPDLPLSDIVQVINNVVNALKENKVRL